MATTGSASATTNWYAQTGTVDTAQFPALLDKSYDLIELREENVVTMGSKYVEKINIAKPDMSADGTFQAKMSEVLQGFDLPMIQSDDGPESFTSPTPGFPKTIKMKQIGLAVKVTDNMVKFDQSGKLMSLLQGLPNSFKRHEELKIWDLINNFASYVGSDGMEMFDTGHPYEDPRGGTWDNLETGGVITSGRIETMRINMLNHKDHKGSPDMVMLKELLFSPSLAGTVHRIYNTQADVGTSANDSNYNFHAFTPVMVPWITSTTAFIGVGDKTGHQRGMFIVECYPLKVSPLASSEMGQHIVWGRSGKRIYDTDFTTNHNMWYNAGV